MLETSPNNLIKRDELTLNFHQVLKQNHKNHYPTSGYWKHICISFSGTEISPGKYFSERSACVFTSWRNPPCQALVPEMPGPTATDQMRLKSNWGVYSPALPPLRRVRALLTSSNKVSFGYTATSSPVSP